MRARRAWHGGAGDDGALLEPAEVRAEVPDTLVAVVLLLRERPERDLVDACVEPFGAARRRLDVHRMLTCLDLVDGARDRNDAGEQLVEHDTTRVDVALRVGLLARELLRRHVVGRAGELDSAGRRGQAMRDSEIAELHELDLATVVVEPLHEHDVLGLDVTMDDPPRVSVGQSGADLDHDRRDTLERERLAASENLSRGGAVEVLHREVEESVRLLAEVEHTSEVWMIEPARGERFGVEPAHEVRIVLVRVAQDLHRDVHMEIAMPRAVHGTGSALAYAHLDEELSSGKLTPDETVYGSARKRES